tara:strand:- start:604 stop:2730 length:2127 start_codon:yes stop_codon:yes gene_type:complete
MQKITVKNIHKSLNENGYICNLPFAASVTSAMHSKPVSGAFLYGPAGTGKSYLPIVLSKTLGVEMFFYQCAPGTREDDLVLKMLPSEDTKSGVEIKKSTVFKAAEASHKRKVMLVLDEWDKTRPTADGFFLDFLQYGRLSIPGNTVEANLENMFIFFTANDEREFHEALLRRFPKIDVDPLAPSLVMSALRITHDGHPHLGNAIKLYEKAVVSGMSKPATIQELRQLLDAISLLGNGADWNDMVYQFVTKTPENHKLLKDAEKLEYKKEDKDKLRLQADSFTGEVKEEEEEEINTIMPTKIAYLTQSELIDTNKDEIADDSIYGVYDYNEDNYSMLAHKDMQRGIVNDDAGIVGGFEAIGDKLVASKPFQLTDISFNQFQISEKTGSQKICNGEIALVDKDCKFHDLQSLLQWKSYIIRKYSRNEVVARHHHGYNTDDDGYNEMLIDLKWTRENGLIMIFTYKHFYAVTQYLSGYSSRKFVEVSIIDEDPTALVLLSANKDVYQCGILNLRKLVNHNHIQFSFTLRDKDDSYLDGKYGFADIQKHASTIINNGNADVTFIGKNFDIRVKKNVTASNNHHLCYINIYGTIHHEVAANMTKMTYNAYVRNVSNDKMYGLPVYKAVKCDGKKLSTHLKSKGWTFAGTRKGLMQKNYDKLGICRCFVFDDFAVFGFTMISEPEMDKEYVDYYKSFGNMWRTVHSLGKSAQNV